MRLRMRRAMKAMAPPVTIPSMGTSTRDCRNSAEEKKEEDFYGKIHTDGNTDDVVSLA